MGRRDEKTGLGWTDFVQVIIFGVSVDDCILISIRGP